MIHYEESSDYGQDIMELVAWGVELMDDQKRTIGEIVHILNQISIRCIDLKRTLYRAPDSYFEPQPGVE